MQSPMLQLVASEPGPLVGLTKDQVAACYSMCLTAGYVSVQPPCSILHAAFKENYNHVTNVAQS